MLSHEVNCEFEDAEQMRKVGVYVIKQILEGKLQHKDANAIASIMRIEVMSALAQLKQSNDRKEKPNVAFLKTPE